MLRVSLPIRRVFCVCSGRHVSTLLDSHKEFLKVIENQGSGQIQHSIRERILEIIISNPEKKNALSGRMIFQFASLIDELIFSPSYQDTVGIILRGDPSGDAFCAGLDFSTALDNSNLPDFSQMMCHLMTDLCTRVQCANVISVAFVEGYALGGGAELSTACDYRMLTTASHIGFVHAKLGASPGWGGGRRLFDIVGRSNALYMLGTGQIMTAQQALNIGLATHVVPSLADLRKIEQSNGSGEHDVEAVRAAYDFLKGFSTMKYPMAVKDLKSLVSSLAGEHSAVTNNGNIHKSQTTETVLMNDIHEAILSSNRVAAEKAIFFKRWGSKENSEALATKRKSK